MRGSGRYIYSCPLIARPEATLKGSCSEKKFLQISMLFGCMWSINEKNRFPKIWACEIERARSYGPVSAAGFALSAALYIISQYNVCKLGYIVGNITREPQNLECWNKKHMKVHRILIPELTTCIILHESIPN